MDMNKEDLEGLIINLSIFIIFPGMAIALLMLWIFETINFFSIPNVRIISIASYFIGAFVGVILVFLFYRIIGWWYRG